MQDTHAGGNSGAFFLVPTETPRLLETPDGWKLVGYNDRELGRAEDLTQKSFSIPAPNGDIEGVLFYIKRLYWSQGQGLLYIQGAPLQRLIGPNYMVVSAERCSAFSVRPHITKVHLALLNRAPEGMRLEEALVLIRRWSL